VRAKVLRWSDKGGTHYARHVRLPARPYMVMTGERRRDCRSAAVSAVERVVREALRGG
jgi:phage gpG-like protein